jgi:hypothetical protein
MIARKAGAYLKQALTLSVADCTGIAVTATAMAIAPPSNVNLVLSSMWLVPPVYAQT